MSQVHTGRRIFVMASFFEDPAHSLEEMDRVREAVIAEMVRLNPDVDVVVAFRLPAMAASVSAPPSAAIN